MNVDGNLALPAPNPQPPTPIGPRRPTLGQRATALIEVVLCSDYLTQFALASSFAALGYRPFGPGRRLLINYVVTLSLVDTALLVALILLFLHAHGERPRDVFLGARPFAHEAIVGLPMTLVAFGLGTAVLVGLRRFAPSLHTVPFNPLQDLIRTPRDVWLFALVVIVAGGVREEVQRAFLLRRFSQSLGGPLLGVLVTSFAFGGGHLLQGADAAIATGTLGALWGVFYLWRRSIVAPMVSHAGFDLLQIAQYVLFGQ